MFRILLFLPILIFTSANCEKLTEIFKWKQIEFESDKSTSGKRDKLYLLLLKYVIRHKNNIFK